MSALAYLLYSFQMNMADMNIPCTLRPEALLALVGAGYHQNLAPTIPWAYRGDAGVWVCYEREGQREVISKETSNGSE